MTMERTVFWKGQPISELPREVLLEVVEFLAEENFKLRSERQKMWPHVDAAALLRAGGLHS